jgi:hypothetical protein
MVALAYTPLYNNIATARISSWTLASKDEPMDNIASKDVLISAIRSAGLD